MQNRPSSLNGSPSKSLGWSAAAACIVAFLSFGVLDFLVSSLRPGPSIGQTRELLAVMIGMVGKVALFGLLVGVVAGLVGLIATRVFNRPIGVTFVMVAVAVWGFVALNDATFSGEEIKNVKNVRLIAVAFKLIGSLILVALGWFVHGVIARGGARRTLVAALAGIGAVIALQLNASLFVGHYPFIHTQLAWLAIVLLAIAHAPLAATRPLSTFVGALSLALLVFLGLIVVRQGDSWRRLAALTVVRGQAAQFVTPLIEPVLSRIAPEKLTVTTVSVVDLPADSADAATAASTWLDENLPHRRKMNVLMIALDTMRADHAGFNGYARNTTPRLDAVAKDAWVFRTAYTTYPTSNFAYASIFNALYPRSTLTYSNALGKGWTFPPDFSLPGVLSKNGWTSIGVTAFNKQAAREPKTFGPLTEGFDVYRPSDGGSRADAPEITKVAIEEAAKATRRPWMMWVHYMEPHAPYVRWEAHDFGRESIDAYDSEIAYTDAQIGVLFDGLERSGDLDNTIICVFSDHGEEFDEHGGRYHNTTVYDEQVRVPLFIAVPGLQGRAIDTVVSLIDVAPTLLNLVGAEDPYRRHGKSLVPLMLADDRNTPGIAIAELFGIDSGRHVRDQRTVVEGRLKLIHRVQQNIFELYDLERDPGETVSLIGSHPHEERLLGLLAGFNKLIDEHHLTESVAGSASRPQSQPSWNDELEAMIAGLGVNDSKTVQAAARKIGEVLFDSMGELLPDVRNRLGESGADELARRLVELSRSVAAPIQKIAIFRLLGELRRPLATQVLEEALAAHDSGSLWAAIALTKLGNDKGREVLRLFLEISPSAPPESYEVAIALARVGDPAALPWVLPSVTHAKMPFAIGMLQALDKLAPPRVGAVLSELVCEHVLRAKPALRAAASAAGRLSADPDAKWLALLLAQHDDPTVREAALRSLQDRGVGSDEIDRSRTSAIAELEGYNASKGRAFKVAFQKWREALTDPPTYNAALRLRFARYLHLMEETAEARTILEDVEKNAPHAIDRDVAARRLAQLGAVARPTRRGGPVSATVTDVVFPRQVSPGQSFLVTLNVRNDGSWPWQGGHWMYTNTLRVRWTGPDGVMNQAQSPRIPLPAGGLAVGESTTLQLVATPADGRDFEATPEIVIDSFGFEHADSGVIYRHPSKVRVAPVGR